MSDHFLLKPILFSTNGFIKNYFTSVVQIKVVRYQLFFFKEIFGGIISNDLPFDIKSWNTLLTCSFTPILSHDTEREQPAQLYFFHLFRTFEIKTILNDKAF